MAAFKPPSLPSPTSRHSHAQCFLRSHKYTMQSFTMTHKDFTINRRQIPRPGEEEEDGIGSKFGQRGWGGWGWVETNLEAGGGLWIYLPCPQKHTPAPRFFSWLQSNPLFVCLSRWEEAVLAVEMLLQLRLKARLLIIVVSHSHNRHLLVLSRWLVR